MKFSAQFLSDLLIRSFIDFDGLKLITRRAFINAVTPVFGFLPTLSFFFLGEKVPKDDNFTISPSINAFDIFSNTASNIIDDSCLDNPTFLKRASLIS